MDTSTLEKITRKVVRQFPEMKGVKPTVSSGKRSGELQHYTLTYKGTAELPGGRSMRRVVRVQADENGNVLRMSTSK